MDPIQEECSLCGVEYRYYSLFRCQKCKRLHCSNCVVFDADGQATCLKCARRAISPRIQRGKYADISIYLSRRARYSNHVTLSFARIEEIIGDKLPSSAYENRHWWSNVWNRSPSEFWMTAGWSVQNVDLNRKEVTLERENTAPIEISRKRPRQKRITQSFRTLALRRKRHRSLGPSKTRIAIAQARLKNIERSKNERRYRGKFKPRKAYEKKLYKSGEKP